MNSKLKKIATNSISDYLFIILFLFFIKLFVFCIIYFEVSFLIRNTSLRISSPVRAFPFPSQQILFSNVSLHIFFLALTSWYLHQYVCKYISLQSRYVLLSKFFFSILIFVWMLSMVKAVIAGFFICHTTDILSCKFEVVHWIRASLSVGFFICL